MKIKCPFCDEVVNTKQMSLYDHWCDLAEFDDVGKMLSDLLTKIHEKIEHWEGHGISLDLDSDDVVEVLKSLLDDEYPEDKVKIGWNEEAPQ